jgi:hypothetical protein
MVCILFLRVLCSKSLIPGVFYCTCNTAIALIYLTQGIASSKNTRHICCKLQTMENKLQQDNPAFWSELEALSLNIMATEVPLIQPQSEITATAASKVPPLVGLTPVVPGTVVKNWCGQAAVTAVLEAHGKNKFSGSNRMQLLLNDVYKWYPPDIFHGTFGTSGNRIQSALKDYGLKNTISLRLEPWILGGFSNPANQASFAAYSLMVFTYVNAGYPAIVMVDNGKLGDDWHVYHWMVLYKVTPREGFFCNATDTSRAYQYKRMNINLFNQAWEAPYLALPGFRFNAVIGMP